MTIAVMSETARAGRASLNLMVMRVGGAKRRRAGADAEKSVNAAHLILRQLAYRARLKDAAVSSETSDSAAE